MRTTIIGLAVLATAVLASPSGSQAQARMGLDIRNGQVENFYFAVGDYYRVPVREIEVVRERGLEEDEIPVVYFIARRSGYEPSAIIQMRLHGDSWMDISTRCGVAPDVYYIEDRGVSGPPFGNAYGYYKHHGRGHWRKTYFSDNDIITSVNVHWMKDRYGCSAPEVIRLRSNGASFASIHERYWSHHDRDGNDDDHGHGRGHGKHKGWKHDG